jgi:hypothetical protein
VRKPIVLLVLAGVVLICGPIPASATGTGVTITFNDATDVLSATGATCGGSIVLVASIAESCTVTLTPPPGYSLGSPTFPPLYLIGESTGINAKISDSIVLLPVYDPNTHALTSIMLTFLSDVDSVPALPCSPLGVGRCNITEDGTVQTAGTITWTSTGLPNIVDTIKFQSDVTPEPASMILFGSGLVIAGGFLRRRRQRVTPSAVA